MASSATPMGARPMGSLVSCAYNAKITHYKINNGYATDIFYGDFVKWADNNPNTTIQKDRNYFHDSYWSIFRLFVY